MSHMLMFTDSVACIESFNRYYYEKYWWTLFVGSFNIIYIDIHFVVLDGSETTLIVAGSAVSVILVTAAVVMLALRYVECMHQSILYKCTYHLRILKIQSVH